MHYTTTHLHQNVTTTISSRISTTVTTTINTTMIITVRTPKTHAIDITPDSPAHPTTVLSFTSATVAAAPTTATKATTFTSALTTAATYLPSTSQFIIPCFVPSNITTSATAADDYTPIPIQTLIDAFADILLTAIIITSATDASSPSARLLYAIQVAAARVSTAADDTSATTTRPLLAIHFVTAKDTPDATGESTPADLYFIDTTDPHHGIVAVSTTTTMTYHHV